MTYQNVFTALADPTRRHIFESLGDEPKSVAQLASGQTVSRPAVSQHLKVLETARLVSVQPEGNRRMYSINRAGLKDLRDYIDHFWSDTLSAYSEEIEKRVKQNKDN